MGSGPEARDPGPEIRQRRARGPRELKCRGAGGAAMLGWRQISEGSECQIMEFKLVFCWQ